MASRAGEDLSPGATFGDEVLTMAVPVDLADALAELDELGSRFVALVRSIKDPDATTTGLEWTLAETAVHVLQTFRYYEQAGRGETEAETEPIENIPAYVARENLKQIHAEPERNPARLADAIEAAIGHFSTWAREQDADTIASFSAGYSMDLTTTVCTLVGELLMHGYDIARTIEQSWEITPSAARLAVYATSAALPIAFDPVAAKGIRIHAELRLRGAVPFSIRIADGRVWTESPGVGRPDVRLTADPMSYLLVGFGRAGLWPLVARGKLVAWGRKPWTMARLPKYFRRP